MISLNPEYLPLELQIFFIGFLGCCIGSFLNVVVYRLPRDKSVLAPSSRCGFCKSSIQAWNNLPLLSFFIRTGQCAKCGSPYSVRYPIIEGLTGILFLAIWANYGWSVQTFVFFAFASGLLAASFVDLEFRIIPDSLSLGGWSLGILLAALRPSGYEMSFFNSVIGSLLGFLMFYVLSKAYYFIRHEEGLGFGDVKLMGCVGAFLGIRGVFSTVLVGSILGLLAGLIFLMIFRKTRQYPIPFGPALAVGALVALFRLDEIWWP